MHAEEPDRPAKGAVTTISIQVLDRDGVPVLSADNEITCHIDGPARLLGLESGNLQDVSDYTDATHRAFRGRLIAYVQMADSGVPAQARFTTNGLAEISIAIPAHSPRPPR